MNCSKKLLCLTAISLLSVSCFANDEDENNWYVRVDIGGSFANDQDGNLTVNGDYPSPDPNNPVFEFAYHTEYDTELEDALVGQLGIGYNISEWFRSDLIIATDSERDLTGTCTGFGGTHDNNVGADGPCKADTSDEVIQSIGDLNSSLMTSRLMLNGYVEFAPLWSEEDELSFFRPYVGFGLGVARNELDEATMYKDYRDEGWNKSVIDGDTNYDFAWQAIAGIGFAFTETLILDIAYTYLDAGTAEYDDTIESLGHKYPIEGPSYDVDLQEVTIGLRFLFS
jgi:opacity protein-like surface antigen